MTLRICRRTRRQPFHWAQPLVPLCVMPLVLLVLSVGPASAEIVFFTTGRTVSVKSHRVEGESLILQLRGGGEVVCESSLIASIGPDEVPYPEPEVAAVEQPRPEDRVSVDRTYQDPRFEQIIRKVSAEQGVDAKLVRAVIQVESAYQPRARSPRGALGLMQIMPSTGRRYGVRNLYDPAANIEAGIKHLKALLGRFPLALALAAYNAGEAAVERFRGVPPYPETLSYVSRIRQLSGL